MAVNLDSRAPAPIGRSSGQTLGVHDEWMSGPVPQCFPDEVDSTRFNLSPAGFALWVALCVFFVYLSHRPLWHTDLWGHLAYGRLIVASGSIPSTEPLMPLCQGVPFVDFSWLSEVLGYLAFAWQGIPALQFLYACGVTGCIGLLAWCSFRKTGLIGAAALAALLYVWVDWQQLAIMRPQLAGCVCFMVLFAISLSSNRPWRRRRFTLLALLFAPWANLHGSFLIGLALLGAFVCGRAGDLLRRSGSLRVVRNDRRTRVGVILFAIATLAPMLNPYGWHIYSGAWQLSSNANLTDLVEWKPLGLWMWQGTAALVVAIGLLVLYLLTPRRISTAELLLLVGFGAATLARSRMIVWWGPVAAYYASLHAAAIWKRWRRNRSLKSAGRLDRIFQVACRPNIPVTFAFVALLVALCLTPPASAISRQPLGDPRASLSDETPIDATNFLRAHPPRGQIFNTLEWGDYLLWAGPPGLEVFVASHVHLVPPSVWQDYIRVITLDDGWQKILERRRINTAIVDDDQRAPLADALSEDPDWSVAYRDAQGRIFVRRRPL
jgi:hypothetical protein